MTRTEELSAVQWVYKSVGTWADIPSALLTAQSLSPDTEAQLMFPTPIGGIAVPSEFAACIVFIALYALLVPVMLFRIWDRRSRTFLLIGNYVAVADRIVLFTLRALATRREGLRLSNGYLKYTQGSFALGFLAMGSDLVGLLRCVLVNPTFGYGEIGRLDESPAYQTKGGYFTPPQEGDDGNPCLRAKLRKYFFVLSLVSLLGTVLGIVSVGLYDKKNFEESDKADKLFSMRYASTVLGISLTLIVMGFAHWSKRNQRPRTIPKALNITFFIGTLTIIVAMYRLIVMRNRSPSLEYSGSGSLNSPAAKACFYIFHILPEWMAVATLLCLNTRKIFNTGPFGDYRGKDDTPKAIQKRKEQEAKKWAKKYPGGLQPGGQASKQPAVTGGGWVQH